MIETTISRRKKVNTGKYENEEIMCSVKAQALDAEDVEAVMQGLNAKVKKFVDAEADKIIKEVKASKKE